MKKACVLFLATGAYSGYSRFAPGTVGSLWGLPLAAILWQLPAPVAAVVLVLGLLGAIAIASEGSKILGKKDPGAIVCDEIIGFGFAVYLVPPGAANLILAFILFRIFDILKPPPIRWIERLPGGTGIVLDDIAAGIYANIATQLIVRYAL